MTLVDDAIAKLKEIPVFERTQTQHLILIDHYKGVNAYLKSMGAFKETTGDL